MIRLVFIALLAASSFCIPVAVFHGVGDLCLNPGMKHFTSQLGDGTQSYARCVEIGNGSISSWLMDFKEQATKACENLKADVNFKGDIAVVGLSQGALIARSIVEDCEFEGKVVKLLSIGGPQMGVSALPHCYEGIFCKPINFITKSMVYWDSVQSHVGPAGYFRDPSNIEGYLQNSHFLAEVNNEKNYSENKKTRFSSLSGVMLVKFLEDTMIYPRETAWFQSLDENGKLQNLNETVFYQQDLIGLRELNEANKVSFIALDGDHLQFTTEDINGTFIPFLNQ